MKIRPLSYLSAMRFHRAITSAITILITLTSLGLKHIFYNNNYFDFDRVHPSFNEGISYSISVNIALVIFVSLICLLRLIRMYQR